MHAVTLRRLLVFGVCAAGVGCLYLVPGVARSPHQISSPRPHDEPTARPSSTVVRDAAARTGSAGSRPSATASASTTAPDTASTQDAAAPTAPRRPSSRGATPFDPADRADDEAPERVADVTSAAVTRDRLTLRWPAASDNVGVAEYRVLLNGYEVATTTRTSATVRWFNADASQQVVQVRAVDAAGNESPASPSLLVARPTPGPSPTTDPEPDPQPSAPTSPEPTPDPSTTEPGTTTPGESDPEGEEPPVTSQNASLEPSAAPPSRR